MQPAQLWQALLGSHPTNPSCTLKSNCPAGCGPPVLTWRAGPHTWPLAALTWLWKPEQTLSVPVLGMGRGDAWLWARCPGAGGSGIAARRGDVGEAEAELGAVPPFRAEPEVCPDRGPIGSLLPKLSFWRNFPLFLSCCVVSHALGFKKAVGTCRGCSHFVF